MRSNAHRPHPQARDLAYPSCPVGTVVIFWTTEVQQSSCVMARNADAEHCADNPQMGVTPLFNWALLPVWRSLLVILALSRHLPPPQVVFFLDNPTHCSIASGG